MDQLSSNFSPSHVPIQLHAHNEYAILFVDSVKQFWHELFETVEQKSRSYVSLEFGACPFCKIRASLGSGTGDGGS